MPMFSNIQNTVIKYDKLFQVWKFLEGKKTLKLTIIDQWYAYWTGTESLAELTSTIVQRVEMDNDQPLHITVLVWIFKLLIGDEF